MDAEHRLPDLTHASEAVISDLRDWVTAHPTASFAEMEAAVEERLDGLRAHLLGEIAGARGLADRAAAEPPTCPDCGASMQSRGMRTRTMTVPGNQSVSLTRPYWVCPACGAGLFPPG